MKKVYKGLLLGMLFYGVFLPLRTNAAPLCNMGFWTGPFITTDPIRSVVGVITAIMGLTADGESKVQLIATQEENNKNACGGGGSSDSTDTSSGTLTGTGSAGASEFSGSVARHQASSPL